MHAVRNGPSAKLSELPACPTLDSAQRHLSDIGRLVAADHLGGCDSEATANLRRQRVSQPVWRPAFNVVPFPPRWIARQ